MTATTPMRIVVISPEAADPREVAAMGAFFDDGLERYHVRKPSWSAADLETWLEGLPASWRPQLVLHQHHTLVEKMGLGGRHEKDWGGYPEPAGMSRSCHDLNSLRRHLGRYKSLLFGPVFTSLTKPFYGPSADFPWEELKAILAAPRDSGSARVLAVGGIKADGLARCAELGFDGAAVLGAVWNEPDPAHAHRALRRAAAELEAARNAA
jgi:thiamine-phosphate pyrophosphorylase